MHADLRRNPPRPMQSRHLPLWRCNRRFVTKFCSDVSHIYFCQLFLHIFSLSLSLSLLSILLLSGGWLGFLYLPPSLILASNRRVLSCHSSLCTYLLHLFFYNRNLVLIFFFFSSLHSYPLPWPNYCRARLHGSPRGQRLHEQCHRRFRQQYSRLLGCCVSWRVRGK